MKIAVALLPLLLSGCASWFAGPKGTKIAVAVIDAAICTIDQAATCASQATPRDVCITQILLACGGDAIQVARVIDSYNANDPVAILKLVGAEGDAEASTRILDAYQGAKVKETAAKHALQHH